ncbi:hypothetical protein HPB52_013892 [Rhipicephalus sanguineus]|uniref:Uncharacterized protein n=1 Tax=Rhipicephalus sanguineus TaxID=34632 RepID=A0A9D4QAB6_RHISA|nr:hypothetical protein HPB52_013892 [Rhipicephalus sanguineus]
MDMVFQQLGVRPRPALDKVTIPSSRHPRHVDTIRVPIRPQAGPPGPFRNPKRRGAALTLTRRACTSVMQRLAEPSVPPTTNDAPPVSPASCCATTAAAPTLSLSGAVSRPTPTTVDQPAAFPISAPAPATCNAGSVLETPSSTTLPPDPKSVNTSSASQSAAHDAVPTGSAPGICKENSMCADKSVLKSGVPLVPTVLPSTIAADDSSTEMDFTASQGNEDNTSYPEGSWNTVRANRKPASTARPRTELITVGIQLPPATLTPKYLCTTCLLPSSPPQISRPDQRKSPSGQTSSEPCVPENTLPSHCPPPPLSYEYELNGKPITIKPYAPNPPISCLGVIHNGTVLTNALSTALRPSAAAVQRFCLQILLLTFCPTLVHPLPSQYSFISRLPCPFLLAKQRECAKAAFLRRTALRRTTQPCPPSSSTHEFRSPPATSTPGSYAAKVKGASPVYPPSSNNTPSPSMGNERRSFDLGLAMLERNQREQQRVSDELQQKIHALTQTLETTTSSLTSELADQMVTWSKPPPPHTTLAWFNWKPRLSGFSPPSKPNPSNWNPSLLCSTPCKTRSPGKKEGTRTHKRLRHCNDLDGAWKGPRDFADPSPNIPHSPFPTPFSSSPKLGRPAPSRATVLPCYDGHATASIYVRPTFPSNHLTTGIQQPSRSLSTPIPDPDPHFLRLWRRHKPHNVQLSSALMLCVLKSWLTAHPSSTLVGTRV